MTSVDSGVETGNDSNDSSIVQHENLPSTPHDTVSTVVATTVSSSTEVHNIPETFRLEVRQIYPIVIPNVNFKLPVKVAAFDKIFLGTKRPDSHKLYSLGCTKPLRQRSRLLPYTPLLGLRPFNERKMRLAAATNHTILMERLLNSGVSPNAQDKEGRTPLHLAASRGYTDIVQLLLAHGANPNIRDSIGNTPLHLAAVTSKISVVTLLLQAGTNVASADRHGNNPLQLAQTKLRMLQNFKGEDMQKIKEEVHNVISMLLAFLQKQKDAQEQMEALSTFCSRLSLSNTSDQVQVDVKDLLANLEGLSITR